MYKDIIDPPGSFLGTTKKKKKNAPNCCNDIKYSMVM